MTVQLVVDVVQVNEPGDEVTVYNVISLPPLLIGAVHDTVIEESPNCVVAAEGEPGIDAGTTAADVMAEPEPTAFSATTENVYAVPFVSPLTVQLVPEVEHSKPPGEAVTV